MEKLWVKTKMGQYPIVVGNECLSSLGAYIKDASQVVVITDQTVYDLHYERLLPYVPASHLVYVIQPGEGSKSLSVYEKIQTYFIQHHVDRKGVVLAFGGGVVGDLAGFVAATYMRGIDFIQIPTTLLAHDSAVGGKVAINHELGKNLLGSFYPPKAVIYQLEFLKTLVDREWRSGLGEMIKHGFIANDQLEMALMAPVSLTIMKEMPLDSLLIESLKVKLKLVEQDEFEQGQRAFLNFGHTFGHGVEWVEKELSHGEAVALGMWFSLYLSQKLYGYEIDLDRYIDYLKRFDYPFLLSAAKQVAYLEAMGHDKKNHNQMVRFVLLKNKMQPVIHPFTKAELDEWVTMFFQEVDRKLR